MTHKLLISNTFTGRNKFSGSCISMVRLCLLFVIFIVTIPTSVYSQDNVYWRATNTNGEWDWGGDCTNGSVGGNWNYNTGGDRIRPDCFIPNTIHFNTANQLTMNLNSGFDFSVHQVLFEVGTGDRVINTNVPRSLYFYQSGANNAKIENLAAFTTHTFNVNVNVDAGAWMEINPVNGYMVFNNPVVNNGVNPLLIWGNQQVTFNGDIMGTPGVTVNGNSTAVYANVDKTYTGTTTINNGATLVISSNQTLGDVVLNNGGTLQVDAGQTLTLTGNWTGGGTIINYGTIVLTGPAAFPGATSTVNSMYNLTINRAGGVSLDNAVTVTNTLAFSSGLLTTTAGNLLTISNTSTAAIIGASATSYINGPLRWALPANQVAASTYIFPVGKGGAYYPVSVIDPVTGAVAPTITIEAFNANCGGTAGSVAGSALSALSTTEYWSMAVTGNLTSHRVTLTRPAAVAPLDRIGRTTTTANGTYNGIGGTAAGNSITLSNVVAPVATQYFVMARAGILNVANSNASSNGDYSTLKAAFAAINGENQNVFNIFVTINGSPTELGTAVLNAGLWTTLRVYPTGNFSVTGNLAAPLINLNGADNVTIDGRINQLGATKTLIISNTSNAVNASTIQLANDANNNTIQYCMISGSNNSSLGVPFGTINMTAGIALGNDNNNINNNDIYNATTLPAYAIYSYTGPGSAFSNDNNIVANNNIYNYFSNTTDASGIYLNAGAGVTSNSGWTISNNRFYQTAARNTPSSGNT